MKNRILIALAIFAMLTLSTNTVLAHPSRSGHHGAPRHHINHHGPRGHHVRPIMHMHMHHMPRVYSHYGYYGSYYPYHTNYYPIRMIHPVGHLGASFHISI